MSSTKYQINLGNCGNDINSDVINPTQGAENVSWDSTVLKFDSTVITFDQT